MSDRLPDGWGATAARDDTLTREFVEAYADLIEGLGRAGGHPTMRTPDVVALDSHAPFPFLNCAVPLRPVVDPADPVLDEIAAFFSPDDDGTPYLVYGVTAMPSLEARGWSLMGHPPLMLRPVGPAAPPTPEGLEIVEVRDAAMLATFDQTLIAAYPVDAMRGRRGFADGVLAIPGFHLWLGLLDGAPVATAAAHVTDTLIDVEWISAMPAARGRRIGEALTWAATLAAPELPALLIASDLGQPIYERMGYLRVSRCTLWIGRRA